jgi:Ulp1 family protease
LSAHKKKLDKYDDRKLKIDLTPEVYDQYIRQRHQGVDLSLSTDHVPLEIHGEIHSDDEARDDEYRSRDADSPPRTTRILRSSRASVQSAEEIHAEIEHKRANVLCVWPKGARDSVSITELDLARLEPNEFLNDVIIDFYLMWIRDKIVPPKLRNKIYFYNSFFYNLLTRKSQGGSYHKVKKWTKHVNIFDYDYLVVPINQHFHWRVCIVYQPRRLVTSAESEESSESESTAYLIMLDSLQGAAGSVYRAIREYLQKEWQDKQPDQSQVTLDMSRLKTVMPKAPTQDNHYDCGIFVLQYVETFCANPVKSPRYITSNWFAPSVIEHKRHQIRDIILKLAEEQGHHIGATTQNNSNGKDSQD